MINDDLALRDLSEVADAIAAGRITSVQATEACLARIAVWQPRTNAFLRLHKEKALEQARAMDEELAAGKRRGPLHGVPMAHKDMYYRAGEISTGGSAIRRNWVAPVTSTVLQKLDAAGVVELGFLNMAEFAAGPTGHNVHHGHCRNPWDDKRVTGGSSSGSGASVAARMVYGALGSDTGGSIRLPASACGVVGMKATYGRVSRAGAVARSWTLDHVGPLTRTVRDNARMLAVVAGHDPDDSTTSEKPVPDYEALLDGGVRGLKIGFALPDALAPVDPQIGAAVQAAADALGKLGAAITPATMPDFTALYRAAEVIVKCEAAAMHRPWMEADAPYANQVRTRMEAGFFIPATQYIDALRLRAHFVREFLAHGDGRRRCGHAAGHPLPRADHRGNGRRGLGWSGDAQHGGALHRPHAALQHARPAGAVGALRLRQQRRTDRPAADRPAVRRGPALSDRSRLSGRDRSSSEGAGLAKRASAACSWRSRAQEP